MLRKVAGILTVAAICAASVAGSGGSWSALIETPAIPASSTRQSGWTHVGTTRSQQPIEARPRRSAFRSGRDPRRSPRLVPGASPIRKAVLATAALVVVPQLVLRRLPECRRPPHAPMVRRDLVHRLPPSKWSFHPACSSSVRCYFDQQRRVAADAGARGRSGFRRFVVGLNRNPAPYGSSVV